MENEKKVSEKIELFSDRVASTRELTESEKNVIGDIRAGLKKTYKLLCWVMKGNLSLSANNDRLNELFDRHELLRRRYLYRGLSKPVSVLLQHENQTIEVMDIRNGSIEKQKAIVHNTAAAEARDIYNPEEDCPVKFRVFVISEDTIVVLMKAYIYMGLPMSPFDMRRFVFFNMKMASDTNFCINEEELQNVNQELEKKCLAYWHSELSDLEKPVVLPFENDDIFDNTRFYSIKYELEAEQTKEIMNYITERNIDFECAVMREFGELFGEYGGVRRLLFAVEEPGSFMRIMPLKVDLNLPINDCYENIHEQIENYEKYCNCHFEAAMRKANIDVYKYLVVSFKFVNDDFEGDRVSKIMESINGTDLGDFSPRIRILFTYSKEKIEVSYTYDSGAIEENNIQMLQETFTKALLSRMSDSKKFDWKDYITEAKSQEEKLEKLLVAQKALYIKEADFFRVENPESVIAVSSAGEIGNYLIEDMVYEAGKSVNRIGILVAGHLEERFVDIEGMVKTVSVYKPGYIIGLESMAGINMSPFSYVAADAVKIMWVPAEILKDVLDGDTKSYAALLNKAVNETNRAKKLWAIE